MNDEEVLVNQQQTTNDNETRQSNAIWEALHKRFADAANNLFSLIKKTDKKVEEKGKEVQEQIPQQLMYQGPHKERTTAAPRLGSVSRYYSEREGGTL